MSFKSEFLDGRLHCITNGNKAPTFAWFEENGEQTTTEMLKEALQDKADLFIENQELREKNKKLVKLINLILEEM